MIYLDIMIKSKIWIVDHRLRLADETTLCIVLLSCSYTTIISDTSTPRYTLSWEHCNVWYTVEWNHKRNGLTFSVYISHLYTEYDIGCHEDFMLNLIKGRVIKQSIEYTAVGVQTERANSYLLKVKRKHLVLSVLRLGLFPRKQPIS